MSLENYKKKKKQNRIKEVGEPLRDGGQGKSC